MTAKKLSGTYAVNVKIKTDASSRFSATFNGLQFAFNKVKKNVIDKINENLTLQVTIAGKQDQLEDILSDPNLVDGVCKLVRDNTNYEDFESISEEWAETFKVPKENISGTAQLEISELVLDKMKQYDRVKQILDHLGVGYTQALNIDEKLAAENK